MNPAVIAAVSGIVGLFLGALIGYYKSKAEFQELLNAKIDHDDCKDCDLRVTVKGVTADMRDGNAAFREIRDSLATMKTDIELIKQRTDRRYRPARRDAAHAATEDCHPD